MTFDHVVTVEAAVEELPAAVPFLEMTAQELLVVVAAAAEGR